MTRSATTGATSIQAGVAAGICGLLVFLVIHHLLIVPIWFIAPVGAILSGFGGAAVGLAYGELLPHLPVRPWRLAVVIAAIGAILLPAIVVSELGGPIFTMNGSGGGSLLVSDSEAAIRFSVGLLGVSALAGASIGWLVGRTPRSAATLAGAGLLLALGPGHNIPMLAGTPAVGKELVILAVVVGVASLVLVEGQAWLVSHESRPHRLADAASRSRQWSWSTPRP